jgi:O-succinylbenzoic acid--CoA ligase
VSTAPLASGHDVSIPQVQADADFALVHTSGTTGRPKIARLSRAAFVASAAASARNLGWRQDDRWLLCLPVCHVGGLSVVTRCVGAGATIVLLPKFDPVAVLDAVARHRATLLSVVPTMLRALLDDDRGSVLSRLPAVLVGGASTPMAWLEECEERRVVALATYGLTEACSQVTTQAPPSDGEPYRAQPGCGRPLAGVEVRVADDANEPVDAGRPGQILVRGATIMRGYLGQEPLRLGAWLQTGDVGTLDALGRLHVEARRSDMIVTGGENVSPAEVERALVAVGAREALVFGVPDERWGQIVGAVVVAAECLQPERLAAELQRRLAPHKRPRRWAQVEALPVNRAGKVDRAEALARLGPSLLPLSYR